MNARRLISVVLLALIAADPASVLGGGCEAGKRALESMKLELSGYVESLKEFNEQDDMVLIALFSYRIHNLANQIQELRKRLDCPELDHLPPKPQVAPAKSDLSLYVDKTCDELRNMVVQSLRSISRLRRNKRRGLSSADGQDDDLRKAREELEDLKRVIRARCVRVDRRRGHGRSAAPPWRQR